MKKLVSLVHFYQIVFFITINFNYDIDELWSGPDGHIDEMVRHHRTTKPPTLNQISAK
jgi:hypothetical protein